ncbi:MAG: hypothetical protein JXJ17_07775 [Anaerolineae bacterium]|nr:hypothetical protein [Anaerolineae bacterium]
MPGKKSGSLFILYGCLLFLILDGCQITPADVAPTEHVSLPRPTETTAPVVDVSNAYVISEPAIRREAVLSATGAFLREADPRLSDEELSAEYTTLAFSCNCLTQPMPAMIDREDTLAVISLPDGLGLFLYDFNMGGNIPAFELSRWTVGLSVLQVSWGEDEVVVGYGTKGNDDLVRVHALLAVKDESGWRTAWLGDEAPGWWFNAVGGQLNLAPDRSLLTVSGSADGTTQVFYETEEVCRAFNVDWQRVGNTYVSVPPMPQDSVRMEWLWEVAEPSPYATLVEFVERLQVGDVDGAGALAADPDVLSTAADFGLTLSQRRYQVLGIEPEQIVFRDLQGTFVADFQPPVAEQGKWLITGIHPPGGNTSNEN